jgi:hypothetical protein
MTDSVDRIEEVGNIWRDKWRELANQVQELHNQIEDKDIVIAGLRNRLHIAIGERNEARRVLVTALQRGLQPQEESE